MVYMIFSNSTSSLEGIKTQDLKTPSNLFTFQHLPHLNRHAKLGFVTVRLLLSLLSPDLRLCNNPCLFIVSQTNYSFQVSFSRLPALFSLCLVLARSLCTSFPVRPGFSFISASFILQLLCSHAQAI